MARAFVAVVPSAPVLDAISASADELRAACAERARWARREQWHLTLRFLGDHVDLDEAAARLSEIEFGTFDAQLGGVGAFSRPSRASVLWVGVAAGCAPLIDLAACVTQSTSSLAVSDDKPYRPHLTVARFDRPADVRSLVHRPRGFIGPSWPVDELVLVESKLGRGPAQHLVHSRVPATR